MASALPGRSGTCPVPSGSWKQQTLHSGAEVWPAIDAIVHDLEADRFSVKQTFAVRLALEEAITNGVRHGNQHDPSKAVQVRWQVEAGRLCVEVEDEGAGFRPEAVPDPLAPENLEREGGRGILLIRTYMSHVEFNERGNCIRMELVRG